MIEVTLIKNMDGNLVPATDYDRELLSAYKVGQGVKVKAVKVNPRSLQHHMLFFGGLLKLTMDYWEPSHNLIAPIERKTIKRLAKWLEDRTGNSGSINLACDEYTLYLTKHRGELIEAPSKQIKGLLDWLKLNVDHYSLQLSPDGIRKIPKSINFASMGQDEFNDFYGKCFSVCWKFILSQTFDEETQAQKAVDELMSMG